MLAGVLILAACGGSSDADSTVGTTGVPNEGPAPIAIPNATEIEQASVHADRLIATLEGDVDAAFDAVAYALNNGYDGAQIIAAISSETLATTGRIPDVEPNLVPPDLLEPQGQGFARRTADEIPKKKLTIQEFRDVAYRIAGLQDSYEVGTYAIVQILAFAGAGISFEQIIEYLVLGSTGSGSSEDTVPPATEPPLVEAAPVEPDEVDTTEADSGDRVYVGTVSSSLEPSDGPVTIFTDNIRLVAGDTLSGTLEFLAEGEFVGDLSCFYIRYQLSDVASAGPNEYSGTVTGTGDIANGSCPGGPPSNLQTVEVSATATLSGDTITVTLTTEDTSDTFVATRES